MSGFKPPHLRAFDYIGFHRYSLTSCTDRRRPLFKEKPIVDLVLSQISRAATERQFAVIAYCFMFDRLHLLVQGDTEASDCKRFISLSKQYSGYLSSKNFKGVLWRYGFERVLRNDEQTLAVAKYILENPVRAKLVENVQDYPFLGSLVYELRYLLESAADESRSA